MAGAVSMLISTRSVRQASLRLVERLDALGGVAGGMVFLCGEIGEQLPEVAEGVQLLLQERPANAPNPNLVFVAGSGVLNEKAETHGESALSAVLWRGRSPLVRQTDQALASDRLAELCQPATKRQRPCALLLTADNLHSDVLEGLSASLRHPQLFGAGIAAADGLCTLINNEVVQASAVALEFTDLTSPGVSVAHSIEPLGEPMKITRTDGDFLLELDRLPALEALERAGSKLKHRPLIIPILCATATPILGRDMVVRGIQGLDTERGALKLSSAVPEGSHILFGVRSARAARRLAEQELRTLRRELKGSAPRFGIYFNCAGRGQALHETDNVDSRLLRENFPDLPIAGFSSAFEIAPFRDRPNFQLYTGVFCPLCAPS